MESSEDLRALTDKVIRCERIAIPDLHGEFRREAILLFSQTIEVCLLLDNHRILSLDVLEWEDKPPVEVTLSIHGSIMDVSLLSRVINTTNPTVICKNNYSKINVPIIFKPVENYCKYVKLLVPPMLHKLDENTYINTTILNKTIQLCLD